MKCKSKADYKKRRHFRVRHKVRGTAERPRMNVVLSNKHMYVQFIDDEAAVTLASTSTVANDFAKKGAKSDLATAKALGQAAGKAAVAKGIKTVVFDRGGASYEGRLQALADAAREAGLTF